MVFSDNGASAEGGRFGSVNEHRFTARIPESMTDNLAAIDQWGGFGTYNHYSWAWAWAGNTPMRLWKRYTWLGGTRTPLIVHWPAGIVAAGEIRSQFAHAIDLMPTVLEATGIEAPEAVDGVVQQRIDGASLLATFDDQAAPEPRDSQYFEMLGSRSMYHDGWKATTDHISVGVLDEEELATGSRVFADDHWALFDLRRDFSESTDVSAEHPEVVRRLRELWLVEAGRNQVLPVEDSFTERIRALIPAAWPSGPDRTFLPGAGPVSDESVPMLFGGFRITAVVDTVAAGSTPAGVLCALGDWNGGYALWVDDGRLVFTFQRAGELLEAVAEQPVPTGARAAELAVSYVLGADGGGTFTLLHGEDPVGSTRFSGMLPIAVQHGGAGLRLGHDAGFPVSTRYAIPGTWNGSVHRVRIETPGAPPADPVHEVQAALHSD